MVQITANQVKEAWLSAGGKNTGGIFEWFEPNVTSWVMEEVPAAEVKRYKFIGVDPGGRWDQLTDGTYKVKDATQDANRDQEFAWNPNWAIIAVRDPENNECVILDGNERALQLYLAIVEGRIKQDSKIRTILGDLNV